MHCNGATRLVKKKKLFNLTIHNVKYDPICYWTFSDIRNFRFSSKTIYFYWVYISVNQTFVPPRLSSLMMVLLGEGNINIVCLRKYLGITLRLLHEEKVSAFLIVFEIYILQNYRFLSFWSYNKKLWGLPIQEDMQKINCCRVSVSGGVGGETHESYWDSIFRPSNLYWELGKNKS